MIVTRAFCVQRRRAEYSACRIVGREVLAERGSAGRDEAELIEMVGQIELAELYLDLEMLAALAAITVFAGDLWLGSLGDGRT